MARLTTDKIDKVGIAFLNWSRMPEERFHDYVNYDLRLTRNERLLVQALIDDALKKGG